MTGRFIDGTGSTEPLFRYGRRSVRLFTFGFSEDVDGVILDLHNREFSEIGLWSRPLQLPDIQREFVLNPGEVMRVYKRYMGMR